MDPITLGILAVIAARLASARNSQGPSDEETQSEDFSSSNENYGFRPTGGDVLTTQSGTSRTRSATAGGAGPRVALEPRVLADHLQVELTSLKPVTDRVIDLTFRITAGEHDDELWNAYQTEPKKFQARVKRALQHYLGQSVSVTVTAVRRGSIYIDALLIVTSGALLGAALGAPVAGLVVGLVLGTASLAAEKAAPEELKGLTKNLKDFSRFVYDLARIVFGGFGPSPGTA